MPWRRERRKENPKIIRTAFVAMSPMMKFSLAPNWYFWGLTIERKVFNSPKYLGYFRMWMLGGI